MTGYYRKRAELVGTVGLPFSQGSEPTQQDYENLLRSIFFPREDDAGGIAVDAATAALWSGQFTGLPLDAAGRVLLLGLLNRLLTFVNQVAVTPAVQEVTPAPLYVSADSFTVPDNQTANFVAGKRIRGFTGAGYAYGTIGSASYDAGADLTTVTLTMDEGNELTSALSAADISLNDWGFVPIRDVLASQLSEELLLGVLGFTPANIEGDTFTGPVLAPSFKSGDGEVYGKLTVSHAEPGPTDGADGDIWFVY